MSLVIARPLPPQGLTFLEDTKLTVHGLGRPPGDGCLKIIIPRRDLCIGFAGAVEPAGAATASLPPPEAGHAAVVEHLLKAHLASEGRTDFLVGDGMGGLTAIRDGVASPTGAAWVGDGDAFRDLQGQIQAMERSPQYQPPDRYGRAWHAFDRVVSSAAHDGVGHFTVEAALWPGRGYRYRHRQEMYQERLPALLPGVMVEVDWGSAETGSSRMETRDAALVGDASGRRVLVLYFPLGNHGCVYLPTPDDGIPRPVLVRGAWGAFFDACRSRHGLDFGQE